MASEDTAVLTGSDRYHTKRLPEILSVSLTSVKIASTASGTWTNTNGFSSTSISQT